jgi:hypothetical protein
VGDAVRQGFSSSTLEAVGSLRYDETGGGLSKEGGRMSIKEQKDCT